MPPFGRRLTDSVVDVNRTAAPASPQEPLSFAALGFSEILVPQDGSQIQLRHVDKGQRALEPIDPDGYPSFDTLRNAILEVFKTPGEANTAARFLTHEGVRLKVMPVETVKGGLWVCRRVRQTPAFNAIDGIADPIRAHLSMLGRGQQGGLVIISGPPNSGKTTTALALVLYLTKASEDVALVIEDLPEVRLDGIVQGSQGRIVQVRAVTDAALYDAHLRSLLTVSPCFAAIGSISSALDARLALDLAMAGILVVTTINSIDIPGAIGNCINRASYCLGAEAARDAVALTLRGVMHQALGNRESSTDPTMRSLNVTSLFLPGSSGNQTLMRKIKDDKTQDLGPDITFQTARIRNNQPPLEDRELTRYDIRSGSPLPGV